MTIKSANLFYTYSRMTYNNWSLKIAIILLNDIMLHFKECQSRHQIVTIIEYYYILKFIVSLYTIGWLRLNQLIFITHIHKCYLITWVWKSQSFSWTTSCFILIECQSRHQIVTTIEYYYILKFIISLYTIETDDNYLIGSSLLHILKNDM